MTNETERLILALRSKPKPELPKQMSPGQQAMAAAQVAWARRRAPHLLTPWFDK